MNDQALRDQLEEEGFVFIVADDARAKLRRVLALPVEVRESQHLEEPPVRLPSGGRQTSTRTAKKVGGEKAGNSEGGGEPDPDDEVPRGLNPSDFCKRRASEGDSAWLTWCQRVAVGNGCSKAYDDSDGDGFKALLAKEECLARLAERDGDNISTAIELWRQAQRNMRALFVEPVEAASGWDPIVAARYPSGRKPVWDEDEWGPPPANTSDVGELTGDEDLALLGAAVGVPLDFQRYDAAGRKKDRRRVATERMERLDPVEIARVCDLLGVAAEDIQEAIARRSEQLSAEEFAKAIAPPSKKKPRTSTSRA